ncbi:MAG: hypothetical protein ACR2RV_15010 [Verrucomicrobiales bacterium]
MPIPLSDDTKRAAEILLDSDTRHRIEKRLVTETSEEIPMWHDFSPEGMERIRFSVIKLIAQNPEDENIAFNHAKMDWRDLFVAAGFGDSATEHERWFQALGDT